MLLTSLTLSALSAVSGMSGVAQANKLEALNAQTHDVILNAANSVAYSSDYEENDSLFVEEQEALIGYRLMHIFENLGILEEDYLAEMGNEVTNDEKIINLANETGYDIPYDLFDINQIDTNEKLFVNLAKEDYHKPINYLDDIDHVWNHVGGLNDFETAVASVSNKYVNTNKFDYKDSLISGATVLDKPNGSSISSFANYGSGSISITPGPTGGYGGGSSSGSSSSGSSSSNGNNSSTSTTSNNSSQNQEPEVDPYYFERKAYNASKVSCSMNGRVDGIAFVGIQVSADACKAFYNFFMDTLVSMIRKHAEGFQAITITGILSTLALCFPATKAAVIGALKAMFMPVWASFCSLFTTGGPLGIVLGVIICLVGLAAIAVLITMFVMGSMGKGFAVGWKVKNIFSWKWYCDELN